MIKQFLIILTIYFIGYEAAELLHLPIPSNVVGMILLFCALFFKIIKVADISDLSDFIIKYLPIFFVVPTVGMMKYFDLISKQWVQAFIVLFISLFVGFVVTGKVTEFFIKRARKKEVSNNG